MAEIHWVAVNPATGLLIAELPGLRCGSSLTTLMGASGGTVNVTIPVTDRLPENWRNATEPHQVVIVAQYNDEAETVLWAGIPFVRRTGSGATIDLTLVDAHGYMDRTHEAFHQTFTGWELFDLTNFILFTGMEDYRPHTTDSGFGGPMVDYVWEADVSTYGALTELAQRHDVEWTMEWRWEIPTTETYWGFTRRLFLYLTFASKIGRRATATVQPFLFSDVEWQKTEDWTTGRAATQVVAIGQSEDPDALPPVAAFPYPSTDPMRLVETISVDSADEAELATEAQKSYNDLSSGTIVYDVSLVVADSDILLGGQVGLGDDVLVDLTNPDLPEINESFEARMVGWTMEPDPDSGEITILKPILVDREA